MNKTLFQKLLHKANVRARAQPHPAFGVCRRRDLPHRSLPWQGSDYEHLYFRFANTFQEPIWNRHYVASVQITLSKDFDVEGRGGFYESVGTLRDVVQNYLFPVVVHRLVALARRAMVSARWENIWLQRQLRSWSS